MNRTQKLFCSAIAAASIIVAAAPGPAVAIPVTYSLNGASVTYGNGATDALTGTFNFDATTNTLSSVNISESGPAPGPNVFTQVIGVSGSQIGVVASNSTILAITFLANLVGNASDPLMTVATSAALPGFPNGLSSIAVTGTADPALAATPIPSAVTLFGTALALFALLLYRRRPGMEMRFSRV